MVGGRGGSVISLGVQQTCLAEGATSYTRQPTSPLFRIIRVKNTTNLEFASDKWKNSIQQKSNKIQQNLYVNLSNFLHSVWLTGVGESNIAEEGTKVKRKHHSSSTVLRCYFRATEYSTTIKITFSWLFQFFPSPHLDAFR